MRFDVACVATLASIALAVPNSFDASDALSVPGSNPLSFCSSGHSEDIFEISKVSLSPNPLVAGGSISVLVSGNVRKTVKAGAYAKITIKYGLIQLISTTVDLCEQLGSVGVQCPVKTGPFMISKSLDMPSAVPPGTFSVVADVYSDNDERITCVTAVITMSPPKSTSEL